MLRPDVRKPLAIAWGSLLGTLVLAGALVWFVLDDAGEQDRAAAAAEAYREREGGSAFPISEQITLQKEVNAALAETIEGIKDQVGIEPIDPFIIPEAYTKRQGLYFKKIYEDIWPVLLKRAADHRVERYEADLGYEKQRIDELQDDQYAQELIRLQLIAKAMLLALSTETPLLSLSVEHGPIDITGPADRPPLLVEYGFTLHVSGGLKEIIWLLHQLGVEEPDPEIYRNLNALFTGIQRRTDVEVKPLAPDDFFPLIVRGLRISSPNLQPRDSINVLEAEIDVAGMEFIPEDQRSEYSKQRFEPGRRSESRPRSDRRDRRLRR